MRFRASLCHAGEVNGSPSPLPDCVQKPADSARVVERMRKANRSSADVKRAESQCREVKTNVALKRFIHENNKRKERIFRTMRASLA